MIRAMKGYSCHKPCSTCLAIITATSLLYANGCSSSFEHIDHQVETLMAESNAQLGDEIRTPNITEWNLDEAERQFQAEYEMTAEFIPTVNPAAADLKFIPSAEGDAEQVISRLEGYNTLSSDATEFDLQDALAYAIMHSRDYRFAEEEFVLSGLRLLLERHLWGPRFFNDFSADVIGEGDAGLFDTSLLLVNEFRITQRLPYGGEVSARALARATEDLHEFVAGENVQSAEIILAANIPLLRGAGITARESHIQSERDLIYSTRIFERFRRSFLFDIAREFLDLVVQQRSLKNAKRGVESLELLEARELALYRGGRRTRFEAALAENSTVVRRDNLNNARERYRFAVDQFKLRIGMPVEQDILIIDSNMSLPVPKITMDEAIRIGMTNRLDLQNERDQLADSRRQVKNSRNELLPDLNLDASVNLATDPDKSRAGVDFEPDELSFRAGITFGLPLDREIERINLRQSQINLERARRRYEQFRDNVALEVRRAVRAIDASLFSLQIQEQGIVIAEQRKASIEADPDRATARDSSESVNDLLLAQDSRDSSVRDLQVSILRYLLDTGQLRVRPDGYLQPLEGMEVTWTDTEQAPKPDTLIPSDMDETGDTDETGVKTTGMK